MRIIRLLELAMTAARRLFGYPFAIAGVAFVFVGELSIRIAAWLLDHDTDLLLGPGFLADPDRARNVAERLESGENVVAEAAVFLRAFADEVEARR